jgi:hypothetical protein
VRHARPRPGRAKAASSSPSHDRLKPDRGGEHKLQQKTWRKSRRAWICFSHATGAPYRRATHSASKHRPAVASAQPGPARPPSARTYWLEFPLHLAQALIERLVFVSSSLFCCLSSSSSAAQKLQARFGFIFPNAGLLLASPLPARPGSTSRMDCNRWINQEGSESEREGQRPPLSGRRKLATTPLLPAERLRTLITQRYGGRSLRPVHADELAAQDTTNSALNWFSRPGRAKRCREICSVSLFIQAEIGQMFVARQLFCFRVAPAAADLECICKIRHRRPRRRRYTTQWKEQ